MNQDKINKITGAVFLIGLGVLFLTGWWWPGIIIIVGISSILGAFLNKKHKDALISFVIFGGIVTLSYTSIPFGIIVGTLIIFGGGWTLFQIFTSK